MITETDVDSFEGVFQKFVALFPGRPWGKRVDIWPKTKAKNPFRAELIRRAQPVIFGIVAWEEKYRVGSNEPSSDEMLIAMAFVVQVVELNNAGEDRNFLSRIKGAFNKSHEMRAILFELQVAVHLFRQGCAINWSSENSQAKIFDMLVDPVSKAPFEVECKSFSVDKGEENTVDDRLAVLDKIVPTLKKIIPIQAGCICVLEIEFKGKISKDEAGLNDIAQKILAAVSKGESVVVDVCDLRFVVYDIGEVASKHSISADDVGRFLERISGKSSCAVMKQIGEDSWMAFSAANARASRLKANILVDAKYAIREQMSGRRPGCLAIQLEGLPSTEMVEVFRNEGSMLHELAKELFVDKKHNHLAVIVFASRPSLNVVGEYSMSEQGLVAVYEGQAGGYVSSGYGELFAAELTAE